MEFIITPMIRAHKIRLDPTVKQLAALRQAAGTARYVYNWALATWNQQYKDFKEGKAARPDVYSICRRWTKEKPEWAKTVAFGLQTRAILNLGQAMNNFWRGRAKLPVFKKKAGKSSSFYVDNVKGYIEGNRVHLTGIGKVKMRERLRFEGRPSSYVVSCTAGQWFVSVRVETCTAVHTLSTSAVGVDVGIKNIAVASDGTVLPNPKYLRKQQKRLIHYHRKLSCQQKGSKRRYQTVCCIAKIHSKIVNQRQDAVHKFTSQLSKNHGTAVIETLDIQSMIESGSTWINRALQDTCMREVHRQLGYKMRVLEKAPPFYPSSKMCSSCGDVKASLPLDIREYRCSCGLEIDRDLNAALNLRNRRWVTASTCVEAPKGPTKRKTKRVSSR